MHGTYYEANCLDRHALGKDVKQFTEIVLQQTPDDLTKFVRHENTANVLFDKLVQNPIEAVRDVYKQLRWNFTPEYNTILQHHVTADKLKREAKKKSDGGKHGMYQHTPDRFGLGEFDFTTGIYEDYIRKYGLQDCKM